MAQVELLESDSGTSIAILPGDTVRVRLKENGTTGFSWADDGSDGPVTLVDSTFWPDSGGGIGAGGERLIDFRSVSAGTGHIRLKRWRQWAGDASIAARFAATVCVQ